MKRRQKSTKMNTKQIKFVGVFVKNLGHITDACKEVGINRTSYYKWMDEEYFREAMDNAMEHFHDSVQRRILKLAMKDNERMLMFWAKNQMKHRGWVEKSEVEVTHNSTADFVKGMAQAYDDYKRDEGTDK